MAQDQTGTKILLLGFSREHQLEAERSSRTELTPGPSPTLGNLQKALKMHTLLGTRKGGAICTQRGSRGKDSGFPAHLHSALPLLRLQRPEKWRRTERNRAVFKQVADFSGRKRNSTDKRCESECDVGFGNPCAPPSTAALSPDPQVRSRPSVHPSRL